MCTRCRKISLCKTIHRQDDEQRDPGRLWRADDRRISEEEWNVNDNGDTRNEPLTTDAAHRGKRRWP